MRKTAAKAALAFLFLLAACGQGGQRQDVAGSTRSRVCDLLGNTTELFGEGAGAEGSGRLEAIDGACAVNSADGRRGGDFLTHTSASLGDVTLEARLAEVTQSWDAMSETPLAPIPELGDQARIARDLPGYQVQIVFRAGDTLVLVSGRSGDPSKSAEELALGMATAIHASIERL